MSVSVSEEDLRTLLFCSIRYSLGRSSYRPLQVQEIVKGYSLVLSEADKLQLAEEIIQEDEMGMERLGDPTVDRPGWLEFVSWLRRDALLPT